MIMIFSCTFIHETQGSFGEYPRVFSREQPVPHVGLRTPQRARSQWQHSSESQQIFEGSCMCLSFLHFLSMPLTGPLFPTQSSCFPLNSYTCAAFSCCSGSQGAAWLSTEMLDSRIRCKQKVP